MAEIPGSPSDVEREQEARKLRAVARAVAAHGDQELAEKMRKAAKALSAQPASEGHA